MTNSQRAGIFVLYKIEEAGYEGDGERVSRLTRKYLEHAGWFDITRWDSHVSDSRGRTRDRVDRMEMASGVT